MLHAIEKEVVLPADGKLPDVFKNAFGRKARIIVLLTESVSTEDTDQSNSNRVIEFAGTIDWPIDDPVDWQRQQRSEWDRQIGFINFLLDTNAVASNLRRDTG